MTLFYTQRHHPLQMITERTDPRIRIDVSQLLMETSKSSSSRWERLAMLLEIGAVLDFPFSKCRLINFSSSMTILQTLDTLCLENDWLD